MINVTKTYLPGIHEYIEYLKTIWNSNHITNNGKTLITLKRELSEYFNVEGLELVSNGTMALQLAIKALGLTGEIITTPFTYVATSTAIVWEGCTPVFVDISEDSLCINPDLIEASITERTSGILATHVYGYPCDLEKISYIAKRHNLKVIYDAAHCFGVKVNNKALVQNGDVSAISFHATKLFHTVEGGAVLSEDQETINKVALLKSFGHRGEDTYSEAGINSKMSEFHAAMGLCMLPKVDEIIASRHESAACYDELLSNCGLKTIKLKSEVAHNYSYYPIIFPSHDIMMTTRQALIKEEIMPRRYFFPSLNTLPYLATNKYYSCPVSESVSTRILCLPMFAGLTKEEINKISKIIRQSLGGC